MIHQETPFPVSAIIQFWTSPKTSSKALLISGIMSAVTVPLPCFEKARRLAVRVTILPPTAARSGTLKGGTVPFLNIRR